MARASDNRFPRVRLNMLTSDSAAEADSGWVLYSKANGVFARSSNAVVGPFGAGGSGSITASGFTMATSRLLGRTTGSSGAIEEITVGSGLTLSGGSLSASGGGGVTLGYLGTNSVGGSTENFTQERVLLKKITVGGSNVMAGAISAYIDQTGDNVHGFSAVLMDDDAGDPDHVIWHCAAEDESYTTYMVDSTSGPRDPRWFHFPSCGVILTAGASYWIGVVKLNSGTARIYYDGSGGDRYYGPGADFWFADGKRYTVTTTTNNYSIRLATLG